MQIIPEPSVVRHYLSFLSHTLDNVKIVTGNKILNFLRKIIQSDFIEDSRGIKQTIKWMFESVRLRIIQQLRSGVVWRWPSQQYWAAKYDINTPSAVIYVWSYCTGLNAQYSCTRQLVRTGFWRTCLQQKTKNFRWPSPQLSSSSSSLDNPRRLLHNYKQSNIKHVQLSTDHVFYLLRLWMKSLIIFTGLLFVCEWTLIN